MQPHGGISRIFNEIIPRICNLDKDIQFNLLLFGKPLVNPPVHPQIILQRFNGLQNFRVIDPNGLIIKATRRIITRLRIGNTRNKIWHSTYYTYLPKWDGPYVITIYDMIYERYPLFFPDSKRVIRRKRGEVTKADVVICISNTTKDDLTNTYNLSQNKVRVIPPGFSPKVFHKLNTKQERKPFFLYLGGRELYKGFHDLLRAYAAYKNRNQIDLLVIGNGFTPEEEHTISDLGIQDTVYNLGNISDKELCVLYNQAEAFIYPSWYEGFGIPLLEAMACGCPIVASRIPSTLEVAVDVPVFFETGSCESLISALDQAVFKGREIPRVAKGMEIVKKYSWEKSAQETLNVYRSLSQ